ncbi:SpdD-like protein [Streptomyces sp. NPDC017056]|uniref:SpdD-like protein n=1 Tax=Streptomyces sp. NPDC017056 TaxID=3364973 RepID=UPI00379F7915
MTAHSPDRPAVETAAHPTPVVQRSPRTSLASTLRTRPGMVVGGTAVVLVVGGVLVSMFLAVALVGFAAAVCAPAVVILVRMARRDAGR